MDVADDLAAQQGREAWERSAISRAYYAAYHVARDYLRAQANAVPGMKRHHEVWDGIADASKAVSQGGKRLHGWRKLADYERQYPTHDLTRATEAAITLARTLIVDIQRLP